MDLSVLSFCQRSFIVSMYVNDVLSRFFFSYFKFYRIESIACFLSCLTKSDEFICDVQHKIHLKQFSSLIRQQNSIEYVDHTIDMVTNRVIYFRCNDRTLMNTIVLMMMMMMMNDHHCSYMFDNN
jgi:hypothetical protein